MMSPDADAHEHADAVVAFSVAAERVDDNKLSSVQRVFATDSDWPRFLYEANRHGLLEVLLWNLERCPAQIPEKPLEFLRACRTGGRGKPLPCYRPFKNRKRRSPV